MLKRLGRSGPVQALLGFVLAAYLKLVRRTNRFALEPADFYAQVDRDWPCIVAMWHGQHFMVPFGKREGDRYRVLISRHGDGGVNAAACRWFGIEPIRGSGGRPRTMHRKGAVAGMRAMVRSLAEGWSVTVTADVPKTARVAGAGIVALARMSGRPIRPIAVVTGRRFDLDSWDRASLGKPFGRGAMVLGDAIRVPRDADEAALERARLALQVELDRVHARAYALVGARDPGAGLRRAAPGEAGPRAGAESATA